MESHHLLGLSWIQKATRFPTIMSRAPPVSLEMPTEICSAAKQYGNDSHWPCLNVDELKWTRSPRRLQVHMHSHAYVMPDDKIVSSLYERNSISLRIPIVREYVLFLTWCFSYFNKWKYYSPSKILPIKVPLFISPKGAPPQKKQKKIRSPVPPKNPKPLGSLAYILTFQNQCL